MEKEVGQSIPLGRLTNLEMSQIIDIGKARFFSHGGEGRARSDGSFYNKDTDIEAFGAEYKVCKFFNISPNFAIYENCGDGGCDLELNEKPVEVVHLGFINGLARKEGNLIINPDQPQRFADIYISVRGSLKENYYLLGWLTHVELISGGTQDFRYGPRFFRNIKLLRPIVELCEIFSEWLMTRNVNCHAVDLLNK